MSKLMDLVEFQKFLDLTPDTLRFTPINQGKPSEFTWLEPWRNTLDKKTKAVIVPSWSKEKVQNYVNNGPHKYAGFGVITIGVTGIDIDFHDDNYSPTTHPINFITSNGLDMLTLTVSTPRDGSHKYYTDTVPWGAIVNLVDIDFGDTQANDLWKLYKSSLKSNDKGEPDTAIDVRSGEGAVLFAPGSNRSDGIYRIDDNYPVELKPFNLKLDSSVKTKVKLSLKELIAQGPPTTVGKRDVWFRDYTACIGFENASWDDLLPITIDLLSRQNNSDGEAVTLEGCKDKYTRYISSQDPIVSKLNALCTKYVYHTPDSGFKFVSDPSRKVVKRADMAALEKEVVTIENAAGKLKKVKLGILLFDHPNLITTTKNTFLPLEPPTCYDEHGACRNLWREGLNPLKPDGDVTKYQQSVFEAIRTLHNNVYGDEVLTFKDGRTITASEYARAQDAELLLNPTLPPVVGIAVLSKMGGIGKDLILIAHSVLLGKSNVIFVQASDLGDTISNRQWNEAQRLVYSDVFTMDVKKPHDMLIFGDLKQKLGADKYTLRLPGGEKDFKARRSAIPSIVSNVPEDGSIPEDDRRMVTIISKGGKLPKAMIDRVEAFTGNDVTNLLSSIDQHNVAYLYRSWLLGSRYKELSRANKLYCNDAPTGSSKQTLEQQGKSILIKDLEESILERTSSHGGPFISTQTIENHMFVHNYMENNKIRDVGKIMLKLVHSLKLKPIHIGKDRNVKFMMSNKMILSESYGAKSIELGNRCAITIYVRQEDYEEYKDYRYFTISVKRELSRQYKELIQNCRIVAQNSDLTNVVEFKRG